MMNDNFTLDDIFVVLCQKFGNNAKIIENIMDNKLYLSDEENEKILNEIYENYITVFSENYPVALWNTENPPVCLFYEGNLDVFQDEIRIYQNKSNPNEMGYIGLRKKDNEIDWCVATTNQENLQPIIEDLFEKLQNYNLKKYTKTKDIVLN